MKDVSILIDGLGIPESTRWRDGRVWLCNWGAGEVLAVTPAGEREVITQLEPQALPLSADWLPDGTLLVVDGPRRLLLRLESNGALARFADLSTLGEGPANEIVVDSAGKAYVNGGEGAIVRVTPDGRAGKVAEGLEFPNGMALVDHECTLVIADSYAQALIAYDLRDEGSLSDGRVWARLEHAPDGICADTDGAIWIATVPGRRCVRLREGGEVLHAVAVDRGCFACMLGGSDGRTLFIGAAEWHGMDALTSEGPGLTGQLLAAPDQPAPARRPPIAGVSRGALPGSPALVSTPAPIDGAVLTTTGLLVQADVIHSPAHADQRALIWHAYLWDPWFLAWGLLIATALLHSRDAAQEDVPTRRDAA